MWFASDDESKVRLPHREVKIISGNLCSMRWKVSHSVTAATTSLRSQLAQWIEDIC